jgi:hypothetical protein
MNTGLWVALGYAAGSLATLLAVQPVLRERYQRGKADGYCDRYDDEFDRIETRVDTAYRRGKLDGFMQLGRDLVRDIGPEETQRMLERMAAMDKVEEAMGGKRT